MNDRMIVFGVVHESQVARLDLVQLVDARRKAMPIAYYLGTYEGGDPLNGDGRRESHWLKNFVKGNVGIVRLIHSVKKNVNNFSTKIFLIVKILFNIVLGIFFPVLTNPFL